MRMEWRPVSVYVWVYSETGGEKGRFSSLIRHRDALFGGPQSDDAERRYQIDGESSMAEQLSLFHNSQCYYVSFPQEYIRAKPVICDVHLPSNFLKLMQSITEISNII
jgi:hypothetical protein